MVRKKLNRQIEIARLVKRGTRRFSEDPRFCMDGAERGLLPRIPTAMDDTALLDRICDAWSKCMEHQSSTCETFQSHAWWKSVREKNLQPMIRALSMRDYELLSGMYRNFFRDACSAGVSGLPAGRIDRASASGTKAKQLQLVDALHRIDLWKSETAGHFALADLKTPDIGNPFGTFVDGVLVRTGCEDQHYCAHKIIDLIGSQPAPIVAEIGGGFGGMAHYLMRDRPGITYVDFDLPETIALISYYLLSAFPEMKATLYGEAELNEQTLEASRLILMPSFAIRDMPAGSADLTFNARLFFDLSPASLHHYLAEITRITGRYILHLNRREPSLQAHQWLEANAPEFKLIARRPSNWNDARTLHPNEIEYLYRRQSLQ